LRKGPFKFVSGSELPINQPVVPKIECHDVQVHFCLKANCLLKGIVVYAPSMCMNHVVFVFYPDVMYNIEAVGALPYAKAPYDSCKSLDFQLYSQLNSGSQTWPLVCMHSRVHQFYPSQSPQNSRFFTSVLRTLKTGDIGQVSEQQCEQLKVGSINIALHFQVVH